MIYGEEGVMRIGSVPVGPDLATLLLGIQNDVDDICVVEIASQNRRVIYEGTTISFGGSHTKCLRDRSGGSTA